MYQQCSVQFWTREHTYNDINRTHCKAKASGFYKMTKNQPNSCQCKQFTRGSLNMSNRVWPFFIATTPKFPSIESTAIDLCTASQEWSNTPLMENSLTMWETQLVWPACFQCRPRVYYFHPDAKSIAFTPKLTPRIHSRLARTYTRAEARGSSQRLLTARVSTPRTSLRISTNLLPSWLVAFCTPCTISSSICPHDGDARQRMRLSTPASSVDRRRAYSAAGNGDSTPSDVRGETLVIASSRSPARRCKRLPVQYLFSKGQYSGGRVVLADSTLDESRQVISNAVAGGTRRSTRM